MNRKDDERGSAGITILWPNIMNEYYKTALEQAAEGKSANNISPIIRYSQIDGVDILWMGDLETSFMENIEDAISLPPIDILFAPHHGRASGKVPQAWLSRLNPRIIVIGEAPSSYLNYYAGYNTITQNSAGDITFDCDGAEVHIYVDSSTYSVAFLTYKNKNYVHRYGHYLGTLDL